MTAEEILTYTIMMRNDRLLIADWRFPIPRPVRHPQ